MQAESMQQREDEKRTYFKHNEECDSNILSVPKSDAIVHTKIAWDQK
jgi:hypothetical protein